MGMALRLRIPELLKDKGLTAYALAKRSDERISLSTAYRLKENRGQLETYGADMIEALLDIFDVDMEQLFERTPDVAPRTPGRRAPKRRRSA